MIILDNNRLLIRLMIAINDGRIKIVAEAAKKAD
jgi:hypothetical protein